jgi:diguanylate cyclase (GGDEF)-like protein
MSTEAPAAKGGTTGVFRFFPEDARQALRVRRYLMAAGTALLVSLALFIAAQVELLPLAMALEGSILILALIVLFYALFRSGLNLRFSDPSLTTEQIGAAILFLAYIMYHAPAAREALSVFYLVAMLFGVLRLETRRLLTLAALALAVHTLMLFASFARHPAMDLRAAYVQLAVLFVVLPWFAFMGGYVNGLRARLSESNRKLSEAIARIEQVAVRDPLTNLYNRRFLMEVLERETARARRGGGYAVCLIDIDRFKSINDSLGHGAGDAVLSQFAEIAAGHLRTVDVLGRIGGEEFLVVLPDTGIEGAANCAERIRAAVESSRFAGLPEGQRVTITAGVVRAGRDEAPSQVLARADRALYRGKQEGRNRVVQAA